MTLIGICESLSNNRNSARDYLEAGNSDKAKKFIEELEADMEYYFILDYQREIRILRRGLRWQTLEYTQEFLDHSIVKF